MLILLPLLSWHVRTCEYITTYNYENITNEAIVIYDNNQDILTHYNQKEIYELFVYQYTYDHHLLKK